VLPSNNNTLLVADSVEQNPPGPPRTPSCNQDFGLALLGSDGNLDLNFNGDGKAQDDFGGDDAPLTMAYSGSGFYAAGYRLIGQASEYVIAHATPAAHPLTPLDNPTSRSTIRPSSASFRCRGSMA
jgi:hypothetical protein